MVNGQVNNNNNTNLSNLIASVYNYRNAADLILDFLTTYLSICGCACRVHFTNMTYIGEAVGQDAGKARTGKIVLSTSPTQHVTITSPSCGSGTTSTIMHKNGENSK